MPFHMESNSNKKSDVRIPRRPGYLEKSQQIIRDFRDDTFFKSSPLERRRSELTDKLERNNKKLQKLLEEGKTIKNFTDAVKQKDDLIFIGEFNRLKKALELPNEDLPNMEEKLGKSREFLEILKTKGINTQKLEANLDLTEEKDSLEHTIRSAKIYLEKQANNPKSLINAQDDIIRLKTKYPSISFNNDIKREKIDQIKTINNIRIIYEKK